MMGLGNNHADSLFFIFFVLIGSLYHGRYRMQDRHVFYEKETIFLEQHLFICPISLVLSRHLQPPNTTSIFPCSPQLCGALDS